MRGHLSVRAEYNINVVHADLCTRELSLVMAAEWLCKPFEAYHCIDSAPSLNALEVTNLVHSR